VLFKVLDDAVQIAIGVGATLPVSRPEDFDPATIRQLSHRFPIKAFVQIGQKKVSN
jgi:hypothetical protein